MDGASDSAFFAPTSEDIVALPDSDVVVVSSLVEGVVTLSGAVIRLSKDIVGEISIKTFGEEGSQMKAGDSHERCRESLDKAEDKPYLKTKPSK